MTPWDKEHGDEKKTLDELILAALRLEGKAFPQSEEEVRRFSAQVRPELVPPDLVERAIAYATGRVSLPEERKPSWAWGDQDRSSPGEVQAELLALHRKEGELSPEVRRKLEEYRKRFRQERLEADGPEREDR